MHLIIFLSKDHIFLWISSKSQGGHCIKKTFPRDLGDFAYPGGNPNVDGFLDEGFSKRSSFFPAPETPKLPNFTFDKLIILLQTQKKPLDDCVFFKFLAEIFTQKQLVKKTNITMYYTSKINWLVVSTHLKNISQNGNLPQIGMKIKNIWNHHLANHRCIKFFSKIFPQKTSFEKKNTAQLGGWNPPSTGHNSETPIWYWTPRPNEGASDCVPIPLLWLIDPLRHCSKCECCPLIGRLRPNVFFSDFFCGNRI